MWCLKCNRKTFSETCEICGEKAQPDIPTEVYWCDECEVPVIKEVCDENKSICPICGQKTKYLSKDLRPVFPEERLLMELLLDKPFAWMDKSVWCNENRYFINGQIKTVSKSVFEKTDIGKLCILLDEYKQANSYDNFDKQIQLFIHANAILLYAIKNEASNFIKQEAAKYSIEQLVVSFSGGKDSTVISDLVVKELAEPRVVHIYGDTTLEFPLSYEYKDRFKKNNPLTILKVAKNKEQVFYDVCDDIGPPARMMRWCCTMFKTGPITRVLNSLYREQNILTFYGIRKSESLSRSKYDRVSTGADVKIQKQTVAAPIFYWSDLQVWLYILSEGIDFNDAYRLGYDRVGCWCCPNNNTRAQFLAKIYMPEEYKKWREYLISFAIKIGKPDPEEYVDGGWWKARQGGNGVKSAEDVQIKFSNCTAEENAIVYSLNKPINEDLYNMFTPFGKVRKDLGRKIINEVIILDFVTNVPIISLQPFEKTDYDIALKVKTMNVKSHNDLQRMIAYQIRKFNACRKCLKCESVCSHNAITITASSYKIDDTKCKRCKKCVSAQYISGGCLMDRFLKVRKDEQI